jgi:hypothetical protein
MDGIGYKRIECDICGIQSRTRDWSCALWSLLFSYLVVKTGAPPMDVVTFLDIQLLRDVSSTLDSFLLMCYDMITRDRYVDKYLSEISYVVCNKLYGKEMDISEYKQIQNMYDRHCAEIFPMYAETIPVVVELVAEKAPQSLIWMASHLHLMDSDEEVERFINDIYRASISEKGTLIMSIQNIASHMMNAVINPRNQSLMDDMLTKVRDLIYMDSDRWDQELVDASIDGFMEILEVNYSMKGGLRYFFRTFIIPTYFAGYVSDQKYDTLPKSLNSMTKVNISPFKDHVKLVLLLIASGAIWFGRSKQSIETIINSGDTTKSGRRVIDIILNSAPHGVPQRVYDIAKRRAYSILDIE